MQDTTGPGVAQESAPDLAPDRSRMARRQRVFLAVAVLAALVSTGGLVASSLIKSPAERAADTKAPPPTLITAPVTMQVLNQSAVLRGTVYPPTQYNITPTAASAEVTQLYVSKLSVKAGDVVSNGQQLAEVSGQPLFVLSGEVPAYRDLKPGATGPDVVQLQSALAELGYRRGTDAAGSYGPGTAQAVSDYYARLGYTAPTTGAAAQQAVDTARKAVDTDQQTIDSLTAQKNSAQQQTQQQAQQQQTQQQQQAQQQAQQQQQTQQQSQSQQPVTGQAPAQGQAAAGATLDQQITAARKQLATDRTALAKAQSVTGPMVPAGEVVFLPALPATVNAVNSAVGSPVSGVLLSLTSGRLTVTGKLTPAQAAGVKAGMAVEVLSEATGTTVTGTVGELGAQTTTALAGTVISIGGAAGSASGAGSGAGGQAGAPGSGVGAAGSQEPAYVPLTIAPNSPLPAAFNGQNVRITVLRSAAAAPVLSVPVAAVFTSAAGQTEVTRVDPGGARSTVAVDTGATANGYVGVTAAGGGQLKQGDLVAVGQ